MLSVFMDHKEKVIGFQAGAYLASTLRGCLV